MKSNIKVTDIQKPMYDFVFANSEWYRRYNKSAWAYNNGKWCEVYLAIELEKAYQKYLKENSEVKEDNND